MLRDAWRSLTAHPWSTTAMAATLALGIGASTGVYAVWNHALLRPIPGAVSSDRLVQVSVEATLPASWPGVVVSPTGETPRTALPASFEHLAAARAMPAFDGLAGAAVTRRAVLVRPGRDAELLNVVACSRGYLDVLGVHAIAGRLLSRDEYETSGEGDATVTSR